jgi:CheY-like chemotaxis protein
LRGEGGDRLGNLSQIRLPGGEQDSLRDQSGGGERSEAEDERAAADPGENGYRSRGEKLDGCHRDASCAREPGSSLKVLLAEDNGVNQRLVVRLLEKRGHHVVVAANGLEALAELKKEDFDLVLRDVQMPEMDGMEETVAIREGEKRTGEHLAVIALTAHAMKGDRDKCLAAGMDGYLTKPIRTQELHDVLEERHAKTRALAPVE